MLSLLSTILSWDDTEREKAGLQRIGIGGAAGVKSPVEKSKGKRSERSAEEEAAMNEVSASKLRGRQLMECLVV